MQRVFDVNNEKDVRDLFDILPDDTVQIEKINNNNGINVVFDINYDEETDLFKINWQDKTEITRPTLQATEADIGKLCVFWNENVEEYHIAIFTSILGKSNYDYNFCDNTDTYWKHCRRLTKREIEDLC